MNDFKESSPRPADVRNVAVIGGGTIGASWATWYLARGLKVAVYDPNPDREAFVRAYVIRSWPSLKKLGLLRGQNVTRALRGLRFSNDLNTSIADAEFVQESAPENLAAKQELVCEIEKGLPPSCIIASSSSGLAASDIQARMDLPQRMAIGHPFNPPHLMPLVELVAGKRTSSATMNWLEQFYAGVGKRVVRLHKEIPGHIANRLQAAVWRESLSLVEQGVADVSDVDAAMRFGPGLRWAFMGPYLTFHLGGGPGGIGHFLDHLGPAFQEWGTSLSSPVLDAPLRQKLLAGLDTEIGQKSFETLSSERDEKLIRLLSTLLDAS